MRPSFSRSETLPWFSTFIVQTGYWGNTFLYLAVSPSAVSAVLLRHEDRAQFPVYYVSHSKASAETRYPEMEQLALALLVAARKLKPYFQAHPIVVYTSYPLKQIFQKPETSGRIMRWAVELSQFEIQFKPRSAIRGQSLADFVAEFTPSIVVPTGESPISPSDILIWTLFVDGSAGNAGSELVCSSFHLHLRNFNWNMRFG